MESKRTNVSNSKHPVTMTTTILVGAILTLLGMFGAAIGVLAAERAARIKQLMPFSAGLLLGIAVFLIFLKRWFPGNGLQLSDSP